MNFKLNKEAIKVFNSTVTTSLGFNARYYLINYSEECVNKNKEKIQCFNGSRTKNKLIEDYANLLQFEMIE